MFASLTALASPGAAEPQAPDTVFTATGKWVVNDNGDFCTLSQAFASGKTALLFTYSQLLASSGAKVVLASDQSEVLRSGRARMTLLPSGRTFAVEAESPSLKEGSAIVMLFQGGAVPTGFAGSNTLRLALADGRRFRLVLDSHDRASAALRTCEDAQLRAYGLDPVNVVAVPSERTLAAFSPTDYPKAALRVGAQGRVVTIVSFDRDGKAASCRVAKSSGNDALDRASCATILRGLRIDAAPGGPDTRWTIHPVRWTLPGRRR